MEYKYIVVTSQKVNTSSYSWE